MSDLFLPLAEGASLHVRPAWRQAVLTLPKAPPRALSRLERRGEHALVGRTLTLHGWERTSIELESPCVVVRVFRGDDDVDARTFAVSEEHLAEVAAGLASLELPSPPAPPEVVPPRFRKLADASLLRTTVFDWTVRGVPVLPARTLGDVGSGGQAILTLEGAPHSLVQVRPGSLPRFVSLRGPTVPVDTPLLDVLPLLHRHRTLVASEADGRMAGLLRWSDLDPVRHAAFALWHTSTPRLARGAGAPDPTPDPELPLSATQDCTCSVILFEPGDLQGTFIDWFTGGLGVSHAAVSCCETDASGDEVIIEAVASGVRRTRLSSYGSRPFRRFRLAEQFPDFDCAAFCRCIRSKVGQEYDFSEAILGIDGDETEQICSGMVFDCLPGALQRRILDDMVRRDELDEEDRDDDPRVSPNDLLAVLDATPALATTGPIAGHCWLTVTLLGVQYDGADIGDSWTWRVTVVDRTVTYRGRSLAAGGFEPIGAVVWQGVGSRCVGPSPFPVSFHVRATEDDPQTDDVGYGNESQVVFCGSTIARDVAVSVTDRTAFSSSTARLVFKFLVSSRCA